MKIVFPSFVYNLSKRIINSIENLLYIYYYKHFKMSIYEIYSFRDKKLSGKLGKFIIYISIPCSIMIFHRIISHMYMILIGIFLFINIRITTHISNTQKFIPPL